MFRKLAILTLLLVCLAAGLLLLRQQRLELANRNAVLYWQIQNTRQAIWAAEAQGATLLRPAELQKRIEKAKLGLEPAKPDAPSKKPAPREPARLLARNVGPGGMP